jgi:hypothetical protein
MPRRPRDEPGEAAVRYGRRFIELMQQRTHDGYVARIDLRLRPSPEVTPIVLPADAAISYYESSALPWERAAFIRARAAAGDLDLGRAFLDEIRPFIWRRALDFGAIQEIRDIRCASAITMRRAQAFGPGFDLARPRRDPRGRILHPGPATHPWRSRARAARPGDPGRAGCWRIPEGLIATSRPPLPTPIAPCARQSIASR